MNACSPRGSVRAWPSSCRRRRTTRRVWRGLSSSERAVLVASSLMLAERLRERLAKRCAG
jgi:hypothetical protein